MPQLSFATVDVFTTTRFRGNPLAIVQVPASVELSQQQKQTIAHEFNLSETVFLHLREEDARPQAESSEKSSTSHNEWQLDIFTVDAELPFAGHPTIGAACFALGTLARDALGGRLLVKAGPIELQYADGVATAAIPHNVRVHDEQVFTAEQLVVCQPALKGQRFLAIDTVSPVKGMNFICVELADVEALAAPHITGLHPAVRLDQGWDHGFVGLLFYVELSGSTRDVVKLRTRMIETVFEDAATGSASCGLASFLALKHKRKAASFDITQGVEMGRESHIGVEVRLNDDASAVETVHLRGSAVKVMEGTLQYE